VTTVRTVRTVRECTGLYATERTVRHCISLYVRTLVQYTSPLTIPLKNHTPSWARVCGRSQKHEVFFER
jgi:hypothetical protein